MKKNVILILLFTISIMPLQASDILSGLVKRILPDHEEQFIFQQIKSPKGKDFFEITTTNKKIHIKGNSPVSLASGFNWYLKYYCHASTSWCGNQLQVPKELPRPNTKIKKETSLPIGFYLNYFTFSYSMAFWEWEEWEKEIDRMAMNGITTPMAMVGVECVWRNTLSRLNYSEDEIKNFIPGPAYMGWFLMGNLERMGGPLPDSWFTRQEKLQKRILARMKEYGMSPVFQAFFGMVPTNLQNKYPEADIITQGKWNNFTRPSVLNPTDPLFEKIASIWYEEYEKLYGTAHYYGGDLFHEGGNIGNINVTEAAKCIQKAMHEAAPNSIWILQSWGGNPTNDLLTGLSKKHTLIVDLCAEYWDRWNERNAFGGFPWIWVNITNWGGNIGLHGRLNAIASEPIKARNSTAATYLKGIGNVPEGIGTNPVAFDLACEMRWRDSVPVMNNWLHDYATYRYGKPDKTLNKAWEILYATAYGTYKGHRRPSESYLCARPSLKVRTVSAWGSARIYYQENKYEEAVRLFASAKNRFKGHDTYEYDLVDFTRQLVANKGRTTYKKIIQFYKNKEKDSVALYSERFLELILLQDKLLSCRPELCVSNWINQARKCTNNITQKDLMEFNARALLTTWADAPGQLTDYAHREWSGLLRDYYYPRWKLFFDWLNHSMKGEQLPEPDYYPIEKKWVHSTQQSTIPNINLYEIVEKCLNFK